MTSSRISQLLSISGGILVIIGYLSPWATVDPQHEGPVVDIKFWRQNVAFEMDYLEADVLTLLPLALAMVLVAKNHDSRWAQIVGLLTGIFYIALPLYYESNIVRMHHVSTNILYVVIAGGMLLVVGAAISIIGSSHKSLSS